MIKGEGCEDGTGVGDVEQAQGILAIHRHCIPPCKRKQAAFDLLRHHGIPPVTRVE